jgi:hypothetical protein
MKYRKKPIIVDAEVYEKGLEEGFECRAYGKAFDQCFFDCGNEREYKENCIKKGRSVPFIRTLEGPYYITPGDYIITGVKGERYPCKPDIFAATYEKVE